MDNAAFHQSPETVHLIEHTDATLLFLPRSSPDFNPIEHDFAAIKKHRDYHEPWALDTQSVGRVCVDRELARLSVLQFASLVLNFYSCLISHCGISSVRDTASQTVLCLMHRGPIMSLRIVSTKLSVVVSASIQPVPWPVLVDAWRIGT